MKSIRARFGAQSLTVGAFCLAIALSAALFLGGCSSQENSSSSAAESTSAASVSASGPSTASGSSQSAQPDSSSTGVDTQAPSVNHRGDTRTEYDPSDLAAKERALFDAGVDALNAGKPTDLAAAVADLYQDNPNAAQSLVNSAKDRTWFKDFKKQLLKKAPKANDLLDLSAK